MEILDRLDAARERWNVLRHPFYQRWSAGTLEREELGFYAGQYRHAVVALADQAEAAARSAPPELREELEGHAEEERSHVDLWDRFAEAFGGDGESAPRPETADCARAWTGGGSFPERLGVLYALESSQPAISRTKLDGLTEHYGVAPDAATADYFALHSELDEEHGARARRLIAEHAADAEADAVVAAAERALEEVGEVGAVRVPRALTGEGAHADAAPARVAEALDLAVVDAHLAHAGLLGPRLRVAGPVRHGGLDRPARGLLEVGAQAAVPPTVSSRIRT